jgi:hypothetical protein
MKSGFIPEGSAAPDELIAGTDRGGQLPPESDPESDGSDEGDSEQIAADAVGG